MKSSQANLKFAAQFVAGHMLRKLFHYIDANPEPNFPRLLNTLRQITPEARHRRQIGKVIDAYRDNPAIHAYINRFFALHPNVKRRLVYNWFVNAQLMGLMYRQGKERETGVHIPNFILLDPTSACNLRCQGCWAEGYARHDVLEFTLVERICREARALGIYWIAMSGGEPFLWPHLIELASCFPDMAFMLYTNGTCIDEEMADRLQQVGNISPAISLEGWRESTDARRGRGGVRAGAPHDGAVA